MSDDYTIGNVSISANAGNWVTLTNTDAYTIDPKYFDWGKPEWLEHEYNNKKGDDDMRYLYEVILVNPKNDTWSLDRVITKSETSALMKVYKVSQFGHGKTGVDFDDLKTSCRKLMEWKKEYPKTACEAVE